MNGFAGPFILGTFELLAATAGFAALMLAMPRHYQDWFGRKLQPEWVRPGRASGFGLIAVSLLLTCMHFGWGYGLVAVCGWWSLAAALVVTANCNRARILDRLRRTRR